MSWILRTNDFRMTNVVGLVEAPIKKDLMKIALKKLGLYWGLAILCIPIPGLHFILVPLFLILGVLVSLKAYKNSNYLRQGSYDCPQCKSVHQIKNMFFNGGEKWRCNFCGTQMVLLTDFKSD